MPHFVVTLANGPGWVDGQARRQQPGWDEHAAFMDGLVDDGFVLLGGPLGTGNRVLLVVRGDDEAEVERRLAADPWEPLQILRTVSIEPWTIWLDGVRH
ncbi:YciI family protein [Petropleomorpha daqingensis]|uniref:Uncharacterized protein YciI n=1 Tax=Petropleomorpha daqingensis TaxID=2026353 RepID=A0A853CHL6_9ACTN|nr:hypothetical protein [Petropleomorpha daqingensis]NYJ06661.1 uncharacterized protein YciI [Petropleomorpha daqingensis]